MAAGVLGGMVKVTTFVPWWTGAAVLVAARILARAGRARRFAVAAAGLIVPVIAAAGWLAFSGAVKGENPLSARLAWSTVAWQHFGPLAMRLDPRSWYMVPGSTDPRTHAPHGDRRAASCLPPRGWRSCSCAGG